MKPAAVSQVLIKMEQRFTSLMELLKKKMKQKNRLVCVIENNQPIFFTNGKFIAALNQFQKP